MLLNDLFSCFKYNNKISRISQQNAITVQWKEIFARFHCTIMKMEISILYHRMNVFLFHMIVNS